MTGHPLSIIQETDAELFGGIEADRKSAFADGALGAKQKLLIAMALDAAHGAANGVTVLARRAVEAGATKQEIMETLRIVYYISGVGSMYTAAQGLEGVL